MRSARAAGSSQALAQSPFTDAARRRAPQPPANLKAGEGAILAIGALQPATAAVINGGLHWRVYADKPDQTGVFRLLKEDTSAQPTFVLPAGNYIVHVAFGLASTAKPVQVEPRRRRARCSRSPAAGCASKAASAT